MPLGTTRFIYADEQQLGIAVGEAISGLLEKSSSLNKTFSIGLSGGSMARLISPSLRKLSNFQWSSVHFFYCDERLVPVTDPESTHGLYEKELFSHIVIPKENIHSVNTSLSAPEAAVDYQKVMLNHFGVQHGFPCFDLLLLGIGPDGHTCSLFPNHTLLRCEEAAVAPITDSPKPPPQRVTLTLPVLNKARHVIFVVSGSGKAEVVSKIFNNSLPSPDLPCTLVQPFDGTVVWYLDKAAASAL
ncbi:hypothetical protein CRM22_007587 [Opisthorchis felineus]|uniref:6-phosphogluconolactonase n=1 Tax=Opisthorchis felineus TaxID=147828 RepID=A0A4V3SDW0_OPIFE|nr:hypothetical protein CRM22_007587 [Opisthorchis felineus]TGZ62165.1 hypothetical protein CRM22_007587 [Opisthorchis felineus]